MATILGLLYNGGLIYRGTLSILRRTKISQITASYSLSAEYTNKKLSYRTGTARRTMSVEILSTATQQYEKLHLKKTWMNLKITRGHRITAIRLAICHFLLVHCSHNDSIFCHFRDITTFTVYVTCCDFKKSSFLQRQLKLQAACFSDSCQNIYTVSQKTTVWTCYNSMRYTNRRILYNFDVH